MTVGFGGNLRNEGREMATKKVTLNEKEAAAIDALKAAIKALPRSIHFTIDDDNGIEFWKRVGRGEAVGVGKPLRCKRAYCL